MVVEQVIIFIRKLYKLFILLNNIFKVLLNTFWRNIYFYSFERESLLNNYFPSTALDWTAGGSKLSEMAFKMSRISRENPDTCTYNVYCIVHEVTVK